MNEWELIELLKSSGKSSEVRLSIGDDAAVLRYGSKYIVITKDLMTEGTHFVIEGYPPFLLGRKLVNSNLSDISAMAGLPKYALLGISIRDGIGDDYIKEILRGVEEELEKNGVILIGGDTVKGKSLTLSMTVIGECKRYVTRGGAKVGDSILLSGPVGYSRAGLREFMRSGKIENQRAEDRFFAGTNRLDLYPLISQSRVNAMIDVSDGFYQDLTHILRESGRGAEIYLDNFPFDSYLDKMAKDEGISYYEFILNSGEEYELIAIISEDEEDSFLKKGFLKAGKIIASNEIVFLKGQNRVQIRNLSFTHHF